MTGRRTKRLKTEMAEVTFGLGDDDAVQSFPKLPMEMWTEIFKLVQDIHETRVERNLALSQMQLIRKDWQAIIKNNIYLEPRITDELLNGTIRFKNVRAKKIILTDLTRQPSIIAGIFNPDLIKEITLGKNANKSNFLSIANHFSENGGVETVIITQDFLDCNDNLFAARDWREKYILGQFWKRITKLVLDVPLIDLRNVESRQVINLKKFLKNVRLPNLAEFKLTAHWTFLKDHLSMTFLFCSVSLVTTVHVQLADLGREDEWYKVQLWGAPKRLNGKDLEHLQLQNIRLDGKEMCEVGWYMWIPLLEAQRHLCQLSISNVNGSRWKESGWTPLNFQSVRIIAMDNYTTLTSLHLVQYHFVGVVDLKNFRFLKKLKTLELDSKINGTVAKLVNITCLPKSLENLIIRGLACEYRHLEEFARAPHLNKLRYLELGWIGSRNNTDKIPERIIQAFLEKRSLHRLHLTPVVTCRVWTQGNREYFVLGKKGYLVPLASDFLDDFRNIYVINFTIDCTDVKKLTEEQLMLVNRRQG